MVCGSDIIVAPSFPGARTGEVDSEATEVDPEITSPWIRRLTPGEPDNTDIPVSHDAVAAVAEAGPQQKDTVSDVRQPDLIDLSQERSDSSEDGTPLVRSQERLFPCKSASKTPPGNVPAPTTVIEVKWDNKDWYTCNIEYNKWDVDGDGSYVSKCVYDDGSKY